EQRRAETQFQRGEHAARADLRPPARRAKLARRPQQRRQRQQHATAEHRQRVAGAQTEAWQYMARHGVQCAPSVMRSNTPPSAKYVACALRQSPNCSPMVKVFTSGNCAAYFAATEARRGRKKCLAAISCPSGLYRYCRNASAIFCVPRLAATVSTTATGGSASIVVDGTMIS